MKEQTFNLEGLSIDQLNKILLGLSKLTFAEVFELVNLVQSQASAQLAEQQAAAQDIGVAKDSE